MLVESLLASLLLMGGCTTSAMSFDDIDSYYDAVVETAVSNIDANYLSDVPDEEETMLLSESSSSSDSNSLQCSLFTYNYYGTRMAAANTNASGMYYNSNATPDVNYFSVMSLNVSSIISQYSGSQYTLYLNVPGSLSSTSTAYYVYDNNGQQTLGSFYAADNTITLEIEMGSSSTDPVITNGYMNLSFFHFTQFPTHENLYSRVTYSISLDESGTLATMNSAYTIQVHMPSNHDTGLIPVILTVHGGTWQPGISEQFYQESDVNAYSVAFDNEQFAHVDISYRLLDNSGGSLSYNTNQPTMMEMLFDINDAVEQVVRQYSNTLDVNNMILWGYSAGAHLAMMYAYGRFDSSGVTSYSQNIKYVVSEAGPTYFDKDYIDSLSSTEKSNLYAICSCLYGTTIDSDNADRYLDMISPSSWLRFNWHNVRQDLVSILCYNPSTFVDYDTGVDGDSVVSSDQYTRINDSLSVTGLQKVIIQNISWKHSEFYSHAAENGSPYLNSIFTHIPH